MWYSTETVSLNIYKKVHLEIFYENYPNREIASRLKEYEDCFPYYRKVKGDGNCFYRSFAFLYLRNSKNIDSLADLFPKVPFKCQKFPFDLRSPDEYYTHFQRYWDRKIRFIIREEEMPKKEKSIEELFNE